jgi:hypothetical protein
MRNLSLCALLLACLVASTPRSAAAQSAAQTPPNEISADLGSCSAQLIVTDGNDKPLFGAKVTTRIHYGLMGVKRLDLETTTDSNGKLKITKLPEVLKKPMLIHISKDDKEEEVEFRPDQRCLATFNVVLK